MILAFLLGGMFQACDNDKTYAEMKEEEEEAIKRFIEKSDINVISMEQFFKQDSTTNVAKNEYVLFADNGVYMQIVDRGNGKPLKDGRHELLIRYSESRLYEDGTDTLQTANIIQSYPDEIKLNKEDNSYSATFSPSSMMYQCYSSPSVPSGWLLPLEYVRVGREISGRAKVKLILPHSVGQSDASMYVYPCFYEISYQLAR